MKERKGKKLSLVKRLKAKAVYAKDYTGAAANLAKVAAKNPRRARDVFEEHYPVGSAIAGMGVTLAGLYALRKTPAVLRSLTRTGKGAVSKSVRKMMGTQPIETINWKDIPWYKKAAVKKNMVSVDGQWDTYAIKRKDGSVKYFIEKTDSWKR